MKKNKKDENYFLSLEKMNKKILQLNLDSDFSCNYNPLEEIRIMSKYEMEDIKNIIYPIFEKEIVKDYLKILFVILFIENF